MEAALTGAHPDPVAAALEAFLQAAEGKRTSLQRFAERYADDFYGFAELLEIRPKEGGQIRLRLTPIQRRYCEARTARDAILKPRQVRITTVELARDLWFALVRPGSNVRVVCQSSTDHGPLHDLSDRIDLMITSLRNNAGLDLQLTSERIGSWSFAHGSTLRILEAGASERAAAKKGRSGTVHRLHTTEVAFWEYASATLNALAECVAGPEAGTEIVHESTANGGGPEPEDVGATSDLPGGAWFYLEVRKAQRGLSGFALHFFPWWDEEEYALAEGTEDEPRNDRERQIIAGLLLRGVSADQARWYLRKVRDKGVDKTLQEYPSDPETCFLLSGRPFFERSAVEPMLLAAQAAKPLQEIRLRWRGADGVLRIWALPEPGRRYVIPADVSEGEGGDRGGGQVWERATGRHMATLHGQFRPGELARVLAALADPRYPRMPAVDDPEARDDLAIVRTIHEQLRPFLRRFAGAVIAPERNNHGHSTLRALEVEQRYPHIFRDRDGKPGWLTSPATRQPALDALEAAVRNAQWTSSDAELLAEMRRFVWRGDRPEAQAGAFDDLVMMAGIGWDLLRRPQPVARRDFDAAPPG